MTWTTVALISGGASLASGFIGASAAKKAAETQAAATREAIAQQREMFNIQNEQQRPYREAGYSALSDIAGMKPYLTKQFGQEDFQAGIDPSYNWRLQQGNLATTNVANQAGGLIGGNALQGLTNYGQNAASTEFGNAFNRFQTQRTGIYNTLAGIAGIGQNAQNQTSNLAQNTAGNIGQATIGIGNAYAGGQIGAANAISGGLQGAGSSYMLPSLLGSRGAPPTNYGVAPTNYAPTGFTQPNPDMGGAQGMKLSFSAR
jgi:hypothetical protein